MSDFVQAYDKTTGKKIPGGVPAHYFDVPSLSKNFRKTPKQRASEDVVVPDGDPTNEWTHAQLDAYAADQEPPVDVSGASNKEEKLALLTHTPA